MATATNLTVDDLAGVLAEREPLIGMTAAAKLLGIKPSNFRRDAEPHLTGIPVQGSAKVYFRNEVEAFARQRAAGRNGAH